MIFSRELLLASSQGKFDPITFSYTGSPQEWVVPVGIKQIQVDCIGASGSRFVSGWSTGGLGGRVQCVLQVVPKQTLYFIVGQCIPTTTDTSNIPAYPDAGMNYSPGGFTGGGSSSINLNPSDRSSRIIVSGGGGGGGCWFGGSPNMPMVGGAGGGLIGGNANSYPESSIIYANGKGGSQTVGGSAGSGGAYGVTSGTFDKGGNGGYACGAGGGGWYCGGGGSFSSGKAPHAGGGGGSSYTHPVLCTNVIHTQGYSQATGNGWITISMLDL